MLLLFHFNGVLYIKNLFISFHIIRVNQKLFNSRFITATIFKKLLARNRLSNKPYNNFFLLIFY